MLPVIPTRTRKAAVGEPRPAMQKNKDRTRHGRRSRPSTMKGARMMRAPWSGVERSRSPLEIHRAHEGARLAVIGEAAAAIFEVAGVSEILDVQLELHLVSVQHRAIGPITSRRA